MTNILIIDDDIELLDMLCAYLAKETFNVETASTGEQGITKLKDIQSDLVILDVMLPGIDGYQTLQELRQFSNVPVIMLTAKGEEIERIIGLEIGADDYLSKPFNPRELLARLRALLRRTQLDSSSLNTSSILELGQLTVNSLSREAFIGDAKLNLTSTEFNLLATLIKKPGEILYKEELYMQCLGRKQEKYDRSLDMHMSNLRKKLSHYQLGDILLTVRGQGYQLNANV